MYRIAVSMMASLSMVSKKVEGNFTIAKIAVISKASGTIIRFKVRVIANIKAISMKVGSKME